MADTIHISFTKAEGSQNDFVVVDDRTGSFPKEIRQAFARAACHRRKGAGADGAVFIDASEQYDFIMTFFNPDGTDGSMCGNGGRCAALYAYTHGIAGDAMQFEALGKPYRGIVNGSNVRLYFPEPGDIQIHRTVTFNGKRIPCHYAHTGAPHVVVFAEDVGIHSLEALRAFDVRTAGAAIRHAEEFQPSGANVNFVYAVPGEDIYMRTFEKGVEDETEACGTGTIATALITAILQRRPSPITLHTRNDDILHVGFTLPEGGYPDTIPSTGHIPTSLFADMLYFEGRANLVYSARTVFDPVHSALYSDLQDYHNH